MSTVAGRTVNGVAQRATGAWLDGDPAGERRFVDLPGVTLELGGTLPGVRLAYQTWGKLSPA
ncbi:MAG TPA: homoserine O-acetyltransferase, partial [Pseudonocardia sp.]